MQEQSQTYNEEGRSILVHHHRIQDVELSNDLEDPWLELKLVFLPSLEASAEASPAVDEA